MSSGEDRKRDKQVDKRHIYGIMLDTETANTQQEENGKLDMRFVLPYDFGFAVIDSHGRVYEKFSFVNSDIYIYEKDLMRSAYYANKLPQYEKDLAEGRRIMANTYNIRRIILEKIKEYDCKFVCAHNARFDLNACNNIQRWTTKSKYRYFFPYDIEFWDTLKMARDVLGKRPTYRKFCEENGYLTKQNQCRYTAEVIYQYIMQDTDFSESHTGLEDVEIEVQILAYLVSRKKAMRKKLFS